MDDEIKFHDFFMGEYERHQIHESYNHLHTKNIAQSWIIPGSANYPYLDMICAMGELSLLQRFQVLEELMTFSFSEYKNSSSKVSFSPWRRSIFGEHLIDCVDKKDKKDALYHFILREFKKLPLKKQLILLKNKSQFISTDWVSLTNVPWSRENQEICLSGALLLSVLRDFGMILNAQEKESIGSVFSNQIVDWLAQNGVRFIHWDGQNFYDSRSGKFKNFHDYVQWVYHQLPLSESVQKDRHDVLMRAFMGLEFWDLAMDWVSQSNMVITKQPLKHSADVLGHWDGLCLNLMSSMLKSDAKGSGFDFFILLLKKHPDLMTWSIPLHQHLKQKKRNYFKHGKLHPEAGLAQVVDWFEEPIFSGLKRHVGKQGLLKERATARWFNEHQSDLIEGKGPIKWLGHILMTHLHLEQEWKKAESLWEAEMKSEADSSELTHVEAVVKSPLTARKRL